MRRDKNITAEPGLETGFEGCSVGGHKTITVAMHAEPPHKRVAPGLGLRNGVAPIVNLQQFAFFYESVQPVCQLAACVASCAEIVQELFMARGFLRLALDVAEDSGIGERHFGLVIG